MAVGVIGFIPFIIFLLFVLKRSLLIVRTTPEYNWTIILFLHGFVMNMIAGAIYSSIFFWGGAGLVLSASTIKKHQLISNGN